MEKSTIYSLAIFLVIIVAGFIFLKPNSAVITGNVVDNNVIRGQVQKVVLSQKGYNYEDATAEANKPITLSADNSVVGCLRAPAFNIGGQKYSKYLQNPQDTLELPALSKGNYNFACSMGMGLGKLIVQ